MPVMFLWDKRPEGSGRVGSGRMRRVSLQAFPRLHCCMPVWSYCNGLNRSRIKCLSSNGSTCECRTRSYHVGVDGAQAVAVGHPVGGAAAAQRVRARRGAGQPHQRRGHWERGPGGQRPDFAGRREGGDAAGAGDGATNWAGEGRRGGGNGAGSEGLDLRFPVHST